MLLSLVVAQILSIFLEDVDAHPQPYQPAWSWAGTKYLVAFGDSYTYVQGTHGLQNYSFVRSGHRHGRDIRSLTAPTDW
jgi:hypothetical protein